jgi:hypothetical protein
MAEYKLKFPANEINRRLEIIEDLERLLVLNLKEDSEGNLILEFSSVDGNGIYY